MNIHSFTPQAREVVRKAYDIAGKHTRSRPYPIHVIMAMTQMDPRSCIAANVLSRMGVTAERIEVIISRIDVDSLNGPSPILDTTYQLRESLETPEIGTGHLLIGCIEEHPSPYVLRIHDDLPAMGELTRLLIDKAGESELDPTYEMFLRAQGVQFDLVPSHSNTHVIIVGPFADETTARNVLYFLQGDPTILPSRPKPSD